MATRMTKFNVIVIDPPWQFDDKLCMSKVKRGAAANYSGTMPIDAIRALPIRDIASDNSVLTLWAPYSFFDEALWLVNYWDFDIKTVFTWVKTKKDGTGLAFGMGRTFRNCSESAIIATRGRPQVLNKSQRNVVLSPALPHSRKPEALQDSLEKMYFGPYLELFARRERAGWCCLGNECPTTPGEDIFESISKL